MKRKSNLSRVLVMQTAKIGDLICSTPIFREIKRRYPDAQLTVMANPVTKELLEYNPYVDRIILVEGRDYRGFFGKIKLSNMIRNGKYDIGISLNPTVPFSIALFWGLVPIRLSVIPNFTGLTFKFASVFYTYLERHVSGQLVIETYLKLLRAIGIESNNISKEVYKSKDADQKAQELLGDINNTLIGIAVSSGNKLKELGTEKIIKLIDMLLDNMDIYVVLIGATQDRNAANIILEAASKRDRIVNAAGRLSLKELPALIERLSLFISVDTGITYMADALSIPIIHLAGPIDVSEQRPAGGNVKIIQNEFPCVPCTYVFKASYACRTNTRECVKMIKIEEVVDAAKGLIKK